MAADYGRQLAQHAGGELELVLRLHGGRGGEQPGQRSIRFGRRRFAAFGCQRGVVAAAASQLV